MGKECRSAALVICLLSAASVPTPAFAIPIGIGGAVVIRQDRAQLALVDTNTHGLLMWSKPLR